MQDLRTYIAHLELTYSISTIQHMIYHGYGMRRELGTTPYENATLKSQSDLVTASFASALQRFESFDLPQQLNSLKTYYE